MSKPDALTHVSWAFDTIRYFGWAALMAGFGILFYGLAKFIDLFRPRY